jgi:hypothetical protein
MNVQLYRIRYLLLSCNHVLNINTLRWNLPLLYCAHVPFWSRSAFVLLYARSADAARGCTSETMETALMTPAIHWAPAVRRGGRLRRGRGEIYISFQR